MTASSPAKNKLCPWARLQDCLPLAVKIVLFTLLVGATVWAVLDQVQTKSLKETFQAQLIARLNTQAGIDRQQFNNYVIRFHQAAEVFLPQDRFIHYLGTKNWQPEDETPIIYHQQAPEWVPPRSIQRIFPAFRFALLLDADGRVREVYQTRAETPPESLLHPSAMLLQMSHGQTMMTTIENTPFLLTSETTDHLDSHDTKATLLLATPIDDEVLANAFTLGDAHYIRALLTKKKNHILVSSDPEAIPPGTNLTELKDHYLMVGKEFFDYGASDLETNMASFAALTEINNLTNETTGRARQHRTILALTLILSSLALTYWITRDIKLLTRQVAEFKRKELGGPPDETFRGDELKILKKHFQELITEVINSREIIKKEARDQTRTIVNNAMDAIIVIDENGTIATWNPSAEKMFGIPFDEALGHNLYKTIMPADHRDELKKNLHGILEFGPGRAPEDNRPQQLARHKDGHLFPIEVSATVGQWDKKRIFIIFVHDITERIRTEQEKQKLITELKTALAEVKTLRGILPICSSCKKIRDDQGAWNHLELYIREHSGAEFSHGMCPTCAKKLYPEIFSDKDF